MKINLNYTFFPWNVPLQWKLINLKLSHWTQWRRLGREEYSSQSFLTSALDGGEWSAWCPGCALAPGKEPPVPIVHEVGWSPEPVWTQRLEEKSFRLWRGSILDRPVVQPVARHYTDWATRFTKQKWHITYNIVLIKIYTFTRFKQECRKGNIFMYNRELLAKLALQSYICVSNKFTLWTLTCQK
jgi:hypothetical protein